MMKTAQVSAQIASLPYDVLRIIFQRATLVPNAFDIHEPDPFAYPAPWPQEKIQAVLFKSMYTNYCLALVCKAWNDVATPLLYRSICISKRKPFMALLRSMQVTLTEDRNGSADMAKSTLSSSKGKWTRRLDILYRDKTVLHASSFARFLKCLPNLQIIVQRCKFLMLKRSDFHLSIFVVLPALVSQSLHVLDVKCSYDYDSTNGHNHPNAASITDAVGNQPLHTLKVCPVAAGQTHKQHAFLSSIECLDTSQHFINPILADICLAPKLKRISLNARYGDGPGPYSKCLAQITSGIGQLEIDTTTSDPGHATLSLHDVANLFPNLHNLVVTLDILTHHVLSEYLPPVVSLGIHTTTLWRVEERCDMALMMGLWALLCSKLVVLWNVPSLRVVRILDELPSQRDFFVCWASTTSKILIQHGVRFKDYTGQLFLNESLPDDSRLLAELHSDIPLM